MKTSPVRKIRLYVLYGWNAEVHREWKPPRTYAGITDASMRRLERLNERWVSEWRLQDHGRAEVEIYPVERRWQ